MPKAKKKMKKKGIYNRVNKELDAKRVKVWGDDENAHRQGFIGEEGYEVESHFMGGNREKEYFLMNDHVAARVIHYTAQNRVHVHWLGYEEKGETGPTDHAVQPAHVQSMLRHIVDFAKQNKADLSANAQHPKIHSLLHRLATGEKTVGQKGHVQVPFERL